MNRRMIVGALAVTGGLLPALRRGGATEEATRKTHRLVLQINQNDTNLMNEALGNVKNIIKYYSEAGEDVQIEIVAHGAGLRMLRADTSPVKERISAMSSHVPQLTLSACNNTKLAMEAEEGKEIQILPEAKIVPAGIVRIVELQEQGWRYALP
jgi:uncharacterized protein